MNTSQKFNIEITTGTIIRILFIGLMAYFIFQLKDIVLVILTAVVIASAIEPVAKWFIKQHIPRVFAVIIVYVFMTMSFIGIFYTLVPPLLKDTAEFLRSAPEYIDSVSLWNPLGADDTEKSKEVAINLAQGIQESRSIINDNEGNLSFRSLVSGIDQTISNLSAGFIHSASSVFGGALSFVLIIVLSFYLAVQEDGVGKFLKLITPRKYEPYIAGLWQRTQNKIALWIQGQLVLAILVGVLVYLGLMVLGVKNALLFAFIAAILEMIPLFGPIIAAIPAVISAYIDGGASAGFIVAGLYVIIQQFENHLIYPLVVKKIVGVPPILVIISLLVGFKLAGFLGVILSVPLASMLVEFIDDMSKEKLAKDIEKA